MVPSATEHAELRRTEFTLTTYVVILKLHVLFNTWGRIQGFDPTPWLDVFHVTHWFERLPAADALWASYHPPLSYLLGRLIYAVYPHEIEASQILSTLAMVSSLFAIRSALRTIGVLWTLPGLTVLYVAASIPLVVWLAIETSYDSLVFTWFTWTLALSVKLFWSPVPAVWWRRPRFVTGVVVLGLVLAAGLLTKFNCMVACGLPWLVVASRRGPRSLLRESGAPLAAVALGVALVAPLYYTRYYRPFGTPFPQAMEWLRAGDLKTALAVRNAGRWRFLGHMLRIPTQSVRGTREPVLDSFIHSIWLQIWKRDVVLGDQSAPSMACSDLYVRIASVVVPASTLLFALRRRKLPETWRALGDVLFLVSTTYCLLLLYFGWKYPLWDWRVFKAKYLTPAILWIPYCVALPFVSGFAAITLSPRWRRLRIDVVSCALMVFMSVNHLLPVY